MTGTKPPPNHYLVQFPYSSSVSETSICRLMHTHETPYCRRQPQLATSVRGFDQLVPGFHLASWIVCLWITILRKWTTLYICMRQFVFQFHCTAGALLSGSLQLLDAVTRCNFTIGVAQGIISCLP